jgi:tetratricopeptide (TPR) repeat protein
MLFDAAQPQLALVAINRFIRVESGRADAHEVRGRILFLLGEYAGAEKALAIAIELQNQPSPDLFLARNEAILAQGAANEPRALTALNNAIACVGSVVSLELAAIELERHSKNWDGAIQRIDTMVALNPHRETWLVRRAQILEEAGRADEAHAAYAQALEAIESLPDRNRSADDTIQLETQLRKLLGSTAR